MSLDNKDFELVSGDTAVPVKVYGYQYNFPDLEVEVEEEEEYYWGAGMVGDDQNLPPRGHVVELEWTRTPAGHTVVFPNPRSILTGDVKACGLFKLLEEVCVLDTFFVSDHYASMMQLSCVTAGHW